MPLALPPEQRVAFIKKTLERFYEECFIEAYEESLPTESAGDVVPFQHENAGSEFSDLVFEFFFSEDFDYDELLEELPYARLSEMPELIDRFWDGVVRGSGSR